MCANSLVPHHSVETRNPSCVFMYPIHARYLSLSVTFAVVAHVANCLLVSVWAD